MQTGIFTFALLICRRAFDLLPHLLARLASFSGGLVSELVALLAIWIIVPFLATVIEKLYIAFSWLLNKFE